jgi:hypothetical protein
MRVPGKRVKERQLIERGRYVVAVEVDLVYPDFDPAEPCYESETIEFLREVAEHADRGDLGWLEAHGTIYERIEAS